MPDLFNLMPADLEPFSVVWSFFSSVIIFLQCDNAMIRVEVMWRHQTDGGWTPLSPSKLNRCALVQLTLVISTTTNHVLNLKIQIWNKYTSAVTVLCWRGNSNSLPLGTNRNVWPEMRPKSLSCTIRWKGGGRRQEGCDTECDPRELGGGQLYKYSTTQIQIHKYTNTNTQIQNATRGNLKVDNYTARKFSGT